MAQGEQVEDANRLKGTGELLVFVDLSSDGRQVGAKVSMSVNDTFWLARCTGGENDLNDVILRRCQRLQVVSIQSRHVLERKSPKLFIFCPIRRDLRAMHEPTGVDPVLNPAHQRRRGSEIEGDDFDSAGDRGPENGDPLGPVLAPQEQAIAPPCLLAIEKMRESSDVAVERPVGKGPGAEPVVEPDGLAVAEALKLRDEID